MNHIGNILQTNSYDTNTNTMTTTPNPEPLDDIFADDLLTPPAPAVAEAPAAPHLDSETVAKLQQMISSMKEQLLTMEGMLAGTVMTSHMPPAAPIATPASPSIGFAAGEAEGEVIEGVFTGNEMLGTDGKTYPMSPNYASKSKLIQGDRMKLTISPSGSFIYKQIGPVERRHMRGSLMYDAVQNQWSVLAEGKTYKILTASVTFHKGAVGSDVSIIAPASMESEWAAVEHIM